MAALTLEREITVAVPPATLFKALVVEKDKYLTKLLPQVSVEVLEGNGGLGTIRKITFGDEGSQFKYLKTITDATDEDNFTHSYSIFESDPPFKTLEKITIELNIVSASADGGSIVQNIGRYYAKGDSQLDESIIKAGADKSMGLFKAVEDSYLANPDAF